MKKSIVLSTIVLFSSQILLPTVAIAETNQQNTTDSNNQNQVMIPTDSSQVEDENIVSSEKGKTKGVYVVLQSKIEKN